MAINTDKQSRNPQTDFNGNEYLKSGHQTFSKVFTKKLIKVEDCELIASQSGVQSSRLKLYISLKEFDVSLKRNPVDFVFFSTTYSYLFTIKITFWIIVKLFNFFFTESMELELQEDALVFFPVTFHIFCILSCIPSLRSMVLI